MTCPKRELNSILRYFPFLLLFRLTGKNLRWASWEKVTSKNWSSLKNKSRACEEATRSEVRSNIARDRWDQNMRVVIYRQSSVKTPPMKNISSNNTLHIFHPFFTLPIITLAIVKIRAKVHSSFFYVKESYPPASEASRGVYWNLWPLPLLQSLDLRPRASKLAGAVVQGGR